MPSITGTFAADLLPGDPTKPLNTARQPRLVEDRRASITVPRGRITAINMNTGTHLDGAEQGQPR
jgi:hypothetical protein